MDNNPYYTHQMHISERTRQLHTFKNEDRTDKKINQNSKSYKEMDKEYYNLLNEKNIKKKSSIINLSSKELKQEYENKYKYYKKGFNFCLLVSILAIIHSLLDNKFLKPSELNSAVLILSFLSASLSFLLIVNINAKALIDSYGYMAFYLFGILESFIFFALFLLKSYKFIFDFKDIKNKSSIPKYIKLLIVIILNFIIFAGIILLLKFIWNLFLEGIRILTKKQKTLFERQLELNLIKENENNRKIEFVEEENLDSNKENSEDNMKIE